MQSSGRGRVGSCSPSSSSLWRRRLKWRDEGALQQDQEEAQIINQWRVSMDPCNNHAIYHNHSLKYIIIIESSQIIADRNRFEIWTGLAFKVPRASGPSAWIFPEEKRPILWRVGADSWWTRGRSRWWTFIIIILNRAIRQLFKYNIMTLMETFMNIL